MSDTGAGHRSCANAIREALQQQYGATVAVMILDVFKQYTPYPFNRFPEIYPRLIARSSPTWSLVYRSLDGERQVRWVNRAAYRVMWPRLRQLLGDQPADVYVSVHPLLTMPLARLLAPTRRPLISVVTELADVHSISLFTGVAAIVVPNEVVYQQALRRRVPPAKLKVLGMPISPKFYPAPEEKPVLRQALGWTTDLTTVLVVSGGEGMGPVYATARSIAAGRLPVQLVVIAGHNQALQAQLDATRWEVPTRVYGFVNNMPELMRAADVIVTKGGASSIMEAINSGLPMILNSIVPGQEAGNRRYVVESGAALWAPGPDQVARAVRQMVDHPEQLATLTAKAQQLARPKAASEIAALIGQYLNLTSPG